MKNLLLALIAAGALSACVVQPAHVRVRAPIVLEPAVVVDDGGGNFCPPGQAKKGRC